MLLLDIWQVPLQFSDTLPVVYVVPFEHQNVQCWSVYRPTSLKLDSFNYQRYSLNSRPIYDHLPLSTCFRCQSAKRIQANLLRILELCFTH